MPSGPALHALPKLMAKPLCFHTARLASANRQTLERLIPKFLGGTSAFARFTKSILAELKDLEPDGPASRGHGRVNYLSTGEPSPMQEGLGTLCQSQEITMSECASWASSQSTKAQPAPSTSPRR